MHASTQQATSQARSALAIGDRFQQLIDARASRIENVRAIFAKRGAGTILRNTAGTGWTIVLPDASEPGRWRHQTFDAQGFSGHCTRDTADAALLDAIDSGYYRDDPEALDRLSVTPRWAHGTRCNSIRQELHAGQINWTEALARMSASSEQMVRELAVLS